MEHLSRRVQSFADEYDLNIELCSVKSCSNLQSFVEKDRREFGFISGITDKNIYNSSFILFQEDAGLEGKIALEGKIHRHCSAGSASRAVLLPGMDADGVEKMVLKFVEAGISFLSFSTLKGTG